MKILKLVSFVVIFFLIAPVCGFCVWAGESKPLVPNEETATPIAEAVWKPLYGEALIEKQKPFHAELRGEVWFVYGSLPKGVTRGGTLEVEISRTDGRVIRVGHGR